MTGFGRLSRFSLGFRTVAASVLAAGAAVLSIGLTEHAYVRWDLSLSGRNTLDESVLDVIDQLPEPVVVDVFFRPLLAPYDRVCFEVYGRLSEVLAVAERSRRSRLEVRYHDAADIEDSQARQRELGVEGVNIVVFSTRGGQTSVQNLIGDVAVVDWGHPTPEGLHYLAKQGIYTGVDPRTVRPGVYKEARLSSFRGEEILAEGLLKVSSARKPLVLFSRGQGEPPLEGGEPTDLSRLRSVLEQDGFEVKPWHPAEEPVLPACDVLALVGAGQAFPPGALETVRQFVKDGGRLIAAPSLGEVQRGEAGGIVELLHGYGMIAQPGIVCEPVVGVTGQQIWSAEECADLLVIERGLSASHPLTEPLRRRARHLRFFATNSFRRGGVEAGGILLDLVSSSPDSWLDFEVRPGQYDYSFDPRAERRERRSLCMLAEFAALDSGDGGAVRKGRVLGVAGANFFSSALLADNRDFLLNAFNWMAEREYRLRVSPLPRGASKLDLVRGSAFPVLGWTLYVVLPGACIAVGALLAWRRRS